MLYLNKRKYAAMNKSEIIITLVILLICAVAAVCIHLCSDCGRYAVIYCDGDVVTKIPLDRFGTFTLPETGEMVFQIDEQGIKVVSSDCPDKVCVRTGYVNTENSSAVCMPNRVIVTIEGE